ncbi:C3a anaphylatoxin chemotactic receptor-like [Alosa sapidissima]|uniref:C3a anaphylatoxin chemotactic receptor-like n=1 Tax=Alosa sapidissima TaxID=34773 RepID=UPI001C0A2F8A|nr:C3a anaphylatoxin chemotactic receptor-like [Alosa sapidissima]
MTLRQHFTMDNSSSNGTTSNQNPTSLNSIQIFCMVTFSIIFVLGVIGNGLVIYVTGYRMKTSVNSVWFLNLALADFLFTLFLIFSIISLSLNHEWPFGEYMCKFNSLIQIINMFASVFLLTAISLDRCLTIWVVVWAHNKRTPNKARLICVFIWLLALACSIPFIISRRVENNRCAKSEAKLTTKQLAVFRFVVGFLIPFLIITCCYVAIGVRARRTNRRKKMRPFLVILAVILAFFICWLPIQIVDLIMTDQLYLHSINPNLFNGDVYYMARKISPVAASLAFLNSCMNPFLYMFMCEEFLQKLKRSVFVVLEHAFAEEHLVYFSSQFSVTSRQSVSSGTNQRKGTLTSLVAFGRTPSVGE